MSDTMQIDAFLAALVRDVAWGFFYDWVNFDSVELYAGRYNNSYHDAGLDYTERFETPQILETFKAMLVD